MVVIVPPVNPFPVATLVTVPLPPDGGAVHCKSIDPADFDK